VADKERTLEKVKELLGTGADASARNQLGSTLLHALGNGLNSDNQETRLAMAKLLLKNGANTGVQNNEGRTPLQSLPSHPRR